MRTPKQGIPNEIYLLRHLLRELMAYGLWTSQTSSQLFFPAAKYLHYINDVQQETGCERRGAWLRMTLTNADFWEHMHSVWYCRKGRGIPSDFPYM